MAAKRKNYFIHRQENMVPILVGKNKNQIINTLAYYKEERGEDQIIIPKKSEIGRLESACFTCSLPIANVKHFVDIAMDDWISFNINANAYAYVQRLAENYEELKRGDLYKFNPGIEVLGLYFLPENVMKWLKGFDWSKHQKQVDEWLGMRQQVADNSGGMVKLIGS